MKIIHKKLFSILICAVLLVGFMPTVVFAASENTLYGTGEESVIPGENELPDSEELFAGYVEQEMYREVYGGMSLFGMAAGDYLSDGSVQKAIYTDLRGKLAAVADGREISTEFILDVDLSGLRWTSIELGCALVESDTITEAAKTAVAAKFREAVNTSKILNCLLADCPYELYWFDKTKGMNTSYSYSCSRAGTEIWITSITISFYVLEDYQLGTYTTDIAKTGVASVAAANAKEIVAANAGKSDCEKMEAYRAEICDLVSYNDKALGNSYGDPWQLIYVFDGNPDTNVVCEGYSKAFQYLCDLSDFNEDVVCYSVCGTMNAGSGAGNHMWNVVAIDGNNYLVDVTNCDEGTVGADTGLFLVSGTASDENRTYTISVGSRSVIYTYDESQEDLFCIGYPALYSMTVIPGHTHSLTLTPARAVTCTEDGNKAYYTCSDCDSWFWNSAGTVEITDKSIVIDKAEGHKYKDIVTAPTGTQKGYTTHTCTVCNDSYVDSYVNPTGWVKNSVGWWYRNSDGSWPANSWKYINGKWYHFNNNGYMQYGWQKIGNKWYYLGGFSDGAMKTGWQKIGNKWYYLGGSSDGAMKTGWQKINNKWYYFGSANDGAMKTGWQKINNKWYYFGSANDGAMKTGNWYINGKWYTFSSSGAML